MAPARACLKAGLVALVAGAEAASEPAAAEPAAKESCGQDVECLLKELTLEEKLQFFAGDLDAIDHVPGVARLGIPEINMGDGPNGVANTLPGTATSFPCNKAIGDSFDHELARSYARAMAKEFKAKGKNMLLGPGVNLARTPQCGRMDEYISGDDPVVGAELTVAFVKGALDEHVMTNIKHFGNNEQETNRNSWSANPDANVNMEYYMKPFRAGVKAGAASIMCGYNKVNGEHACKNKDIMQAAKKWSDSFVIVSDWGAIYPDAADGGAAEYINAGVDIEMGAHDDANCDSPDAQATEYGGAGYCNKGDYMLPSRMRAMLDSGAITMERVDETVLRVLKALKTAGLLDPEAQKEFPAYTHLDYHSKWYGPLTQNDVRTQGSRQAAQEVATKALVMLQNTGDLLPVAKTQKVATYGCSNGEVHFHAESGSASGTAPNLPKEPCKANGETACAFPEDALRAAGMDVEAHSFQDGFAGPTDPERLTVVCLMAKSFNDEGTDRSTLEMQDFPFDLFDKVVVWAIAPGPVMLDFAPRVDALLLTALPGEMGGAAFADVFLGKSSPAGHLTMTMPGAAMRGGMLLSTVEDNYAEGFEVGYRAYEARKQVPTFCFGYGLSYAKYMRVTDAQFRAPLEAGHRPSVVVQLQRDHDPAGERIDEVDQVVQVYVQHAAPKARNFKELAGFGKVRGLKAGGSAELKIEFDAPETWGSAVGDKSAGYATGSWEPVEEYTIFLSLHGVEHARALGVVKVQNGDYTGEVLYHFGQKGPMDFDQDLTAWERASARQEPMERPKGHVFGAIARYDVAAPAGVALAETRPTASGLAAALGLVAALVAVAAAVLRGRRGAPEEDRQELLEADEGRA